MMSYAAPSESPDGVELNVRKISSVTVTLSAESYYEQQGCSVRLRVVLCHRLLKGDGMPVLNLAEVPWL